MRLHYAMKLNGVRVTRQIAGAGIPLAVRSWRQRAVQAGTVRMRKREPKPVDEAWLASKRRRRG